MGRGRTTLPSDIGRPVSNFLVIRAADSAEIRGQCIVPDVKNVGLFARHGNAPANCGARDAEIAEAAFDETEYFIAAGFRLDKIRVLGVPIEKRFLKGRKFEEIVWLGNSFRGPAAIGTVLPWLHVHVSIVVNAVLPGVVTGVNETVFAAQFEKPLHGVGVFQVGGADKFVALNTEFLPQGAPLPGHFRHEFGFGDACLFGGALDVDAVLVRAGGHDDVVAAHAFVAADGVAHDRRIRVADVRQAVRVVDRRGQIVFGFVGHFLIWSVLSRQCSVVSC